MSWATSKDKTFSIEYRWADFKPDRASTLAAELVRLNVNVIVATGGPTPSTAAKRATKTIPIVFTAANPVGTGLVASLNRPGGNMTGINVLSPELDGKRLDLLKEAVPGISRVAVLANPANAVTAGALKDREGAARALRLKLHVLEVRERQGTDDTLRSDGQRAGPRLDPADAAPTGGSGDRVARAGSRALGP